MPKSVRALFFLVAAILVVVATRARTTTSTPLASQPPRGADPSSSARPAPSTGSPGDVSAAFRDHVQKTEVEDGGTVERWLPDDLEGSRHQRLIVKVANGRTIMIAYNIDLAPRLPEFSRGDSVRFHGEYIWNARGGIVHWTHHDPSHKHEDGWIRNHGMMYQ